MTAKELTALCVRWQEILRLRDWDVKIQFSRAFEMDGEEQGSVSAVTTKKSALIKILDERDYPTDIQWPQDIECTVVHELVHLHMIPFDTFGKETLEGKSLEQAVECIACALVRQHGHR
jgi:hypothetical protein